MATFFVGLIDLTFWLQICIIKEKISVRKDGQENRHLVAIIYHLRSRYHSVSYIIRDRKERISLKKSPLSVDKSDFFHVKERLKVV